MELNTKGYNLLVPSLIFEVTNTCNLKCRFCYNQIRRANTYILPNHFEKVLKKYKPLFLMLTGGEITTHPYLKEIIRIGIKKSIKMQISTNGVELNMIIENIIDSSNKPIINISLDAADEDHDIIRNSKGLLNRIITTIKENRKYKIPFTFNCTVFPKNVIPTLPEGNLKHITNLIMLAEELKVPINFQPYAPADKNVRKKLGLILLKSESKYILNTLSYCKLLIDGHNGDCRFNILSKSIDINGNELPTNLNDCYFCKDCSKCYYSCVWEPGLLTTRFFWISLVSFLFRNNIAHLLRRSYLRKYE